MTKIQKLTAFQTLQKYSPTVIETTYEALQTAFDAGWNCCASIKDKEIEDLIEKYEKLINNLNGVNEK